MPSPRDFRGSRRGLALVFRDGPKTASEAGQALGKPTGAIFGVLKRMAADGLLVADTDEPGRGTRYRLSPEADAVLRAMERDAEEPVVGVLVENHQVVLIERPKVARQEAARRVLAQGWVAEAVLWAAESAAGWVVVLASARQAERLQLELMQIKVRTSMIDVDRLMTGAELSRDSAWLLEDVENGDRTS